MMKNLKIKSLLLGITFIAIPFAQTAYANTSTNSYRYNAQSSDVNTDAALVRINKGTASFSDYQKIGLYFTQDDADILTLNRDIKGYREFRDSDISKEEIAGLVNSQLSYNKEVINRINTGAYCYQYDYSNLGIYLEEYQVEAVTSYCRQVDSSTVTKIKANVPIALNALAIINNGSGSIDDYRKLGFTFSENDLSLTFLNSIVRIERNNRGHNLSRSEILGIVNYVLDYTKYNS